MPRKKRIKTKKVGDCSKDIDMRIVDKMLAAHSPGTRIASFIGVNPSTLYRFIEKEKGVNFAVYSQSKKENAEEILRSKIFEYAINGNVSLMRDLAREWNILGQNKTLEVSPSSIRSEIVSEMETCDSESGSEITDLAT